MLVSSISSVLVSPTSLNTPGILFLLVLPGERNYCRVGLLQITVAVEGGLPSRLGPPVILPYRVAFSSRYSQRHNQIFTEAHIFKSTSQPSFVACRGRCEAFLAQSWLAQQDERGREEVKEKVRETQG